MTNEASATDAGETATVIDADGTTIVLPPGTTMIIQANATAAAENNATSDAVTVENETENKNGTDTATTVAADLEVSTIGAADNDTDVFTSAKPSNGHGADDEGASNDTSTATGVSDEAVTVDTATVDTNITTIADNGTVTDELAETTASSNDTAAESNESNATTIGTDRVTPASDWPRMVCVHDMTTYECISVRSLSPSFSTCSPCSPVSCMRRFLRTMDSSVLLCFCSFRCR